MGFTSRASPATVPGFVVSGGALMPRSLADIDRDIGKASSQMRGALADLARLDHERRAHVAAEAPKPRSADPQRLRYQRKRRDRS